MARRRFAAICRKKSRFHGQIVNYMLDTWLDHGSNGGKNAVRNHNGGWDRRESKGSVFEDRPGVCWSPIIYLFVNSYMSVPWEWCHSNTRQRDYHNRVAKLRANSMFPYCLPDDITFYPLIPLTKSRPYKNASIKYCGNLYYIIVPYFILRIWLFPSKDPQYHSSHRFKPHGSVRLRLCQ